MKIKELRKLPLADCKAKTIYDSIILVNTRKKHDSGYALMAIIGLDEKQKPIEIVGFCDDVKWNFNGLTFSNDMFYPSGVIHFWSTEAKFAVGPCFSTTDIMLLPK
jgi:hypothetical protein